MAKKADLSHVSCERPCHELDWPMICRFKLTLEMHQVMGGWCGECPSNETHCFRPGCIVADGMVRRIMAAGRSMPGPTLQVCQNDIIVVDVENRIPGQAVTLHWRGQVQKGSPYMDGVPMVTQCPVQTYTTFQYKFRATGVGTHLWHAHSGFELSDGLFGAFIVKKADRVEETRHLYDYDIPGHVLIVNEWGSTTPIAPLGKQEPTLLVNGIASKMSNLVPRVVVRQGFRYRIRLAYAGQGCPVTITPDQHPPLVIALDGHLITPKAVETIKIASGERVDFIIHADHEPGTYDIKINSSCSHVPGVAKIVYNTTVDPTHEPTEADTQTSVHEDLEENQSEASYKLLSTVPDPLCHVHHLHTAVCLPQLESRKTMPADLAGKVDIRLYLPFDIVPYTDKVVSIGDMKPRINNITFVFPPAPILSQTSDSSDLVCKAERLPVGCSTQNSTCECVHAIDIPLNSKVEIILIDQDNFPYTDHVFHLHGHQFYVVGTSEKLQEHSVDKIKTMDAKGLLIHRNLKDPVRKDTVMIPKNGAVAIRFKADNPGFWLLHDQSAALWTSGLDVLLKVGETSDFPSEPDNFPHCGSWVGPEFFLI